MNSTASVCQTKDGILLKNKHVMAAFSSDGRLRRIGAASGRYAFDLAPLPGGTGGVLWQIIFRSPEGKLIPVEPEGTCILDEARSEGKAAVILNWNTNVLDEPVGIRMAVSLADDESFTRWNTAVTYSGRLALWEVSAPRLACLGPLAEDGRNDILTCPFQQGFLVRNPTAVIQSGDNAEFGTQEEYGSLDNENSPNAYNSKIAFSYPGMWAMQFLALSNPAAGGLYFAAHDGSARYKRFGVYGRKGADKMEMVMRHYPDDRLAAGLSYETPYDTVIGVFNGPWWNASKIYRAWAIQQEWCRRGPLHQRRDMPRWIMDTDVWYWNWRVKARFGHRGTVNDIMPAVIDLKKRLGAKIAIHWYECNEERFNARCPDLFPALPGVSERLRRAMKRLHRHGIHAIPYINARLWDSLLPSWKAAHAETAVTRQADGAPGDPWDERGMFPGVAYPVSRESWDSHAVSPLGLWYTMCPATKLWQDKIIDLCRRVLKEWDMDGAYLDQITSCYVVPCFADHHGHSRGGGNSWYTGYRRMMERIRDELLPDCPRAAYTSESTVECWLDLFDANLAREVGANRGVMESAPLFHSVYHDYALTYGTVQQLSEPFPDKYYFGEALVLNTGQALAIEDYYANDIGTDRYRHYLEYFKTLCHARKSAHAWLTVGQWMPPVDLQTPLCRIQVAQKDCITVPAVLTSAWQLPDGRVCLLFINHTGYPQAIRYTVRGRDYGFPGQPLRLAERRGTREWPIETALDTTFSRPAMIDRRSIRLFIVEPHARGASSSKAVRTKLKPNKRRPASKN